MTARIPRGRKREGRRLRLPRQLSTRALGPKPPDRIVDDVTGLYLDVLEKLFRSLGPEIEKFIFQTSGSRPARADAFSLDVFRLRIEDLLDERTIAQAVSTAAGQVSRAVDRDLLQIPGIVTSGTLAGGAVQLAAFRERNVNLIRTAGRDALRRIERTLNANAGLHVAGLRKKLQSEFNVSKSRAQLWARDQTLKLYSNVNQARQRGAGIKQYVWTTSQDERVRDGSAGPLDHVSLEGRVFSWDDPPDVGDGRHLHPGEDYQCRCTATPILPSPDEIS